MAKNPTNAKPSGTARQAKIQAAQKASGGGANKIVVATVVVVVAIVAVVAGVIWMETSKKNDITGGGNAVPAGVAALGAGYPAYQDVTLAPGAPTLDVYEDFQCPACKSFEDQLGSTVEGLASEGKVKLVYHVKNFLDDNLRNDSSTKAGNAAFCAADAGKFQEFHDQVYANQPAQEGTGFPDAQLRSFAEAAGIWGPPWTRGSSATTPASTSTTSTRSRPRASRTASRAPRRCGSTAPTSTSARSAPPSCSRRPSRTPPSDARRRPEVVALT